MSHPSSLSRVFVQVLPLSYRRFFSEQNLDWAGSSLNYLFSHFFFSKLTFSQRHVPQKAHISGKTFPGRPFSEFVLTGQLLL